MGEFDEAGCLADAAAVLAARQRVDALLCRLSLQAFDVDAVDQLRRWIDEEYPPAAAAWRRLHNLAPFTAELLREVPPADLFSRVGSLPPASSSRVGGRAIPSSRSRPRKR